MDELSVLDLFRIGIGPSSSHTVGPMRAAARFLRELGGALDRVARVQVDLYGSLALTGKGHHTDRALLLGLLGEHPETIDPEAMESRLAGVRAQGQLSLLERRVVRFREEDDIRWHQHEVLPQHPNGLRFTATDAEGTVVGEAEFYSIGGGFVVSAEEARAGHTGGRVPERPLPYAFRTAQDLLDLGRETGKRIPELVLANERAWRPEGETLARLDQIAEAMHACIERGCRGEGILPGGLKVRRRAARLKRTLEDGSLADDPLATLDWVSLFALAVNEENAAGGRVVTAPTNGAAGVIPAVLEYYKRFVKGASSEGVRTFLLTAGAIGMLYKRNASLSAAEMGCQGEVGVACSMAAAGLAAVLGGSNLQIEEAAEVGMEHNLGLTCDPIRGLVQVPCIERNTMGAAKAVNAARLAVFHSDGQHTVPLDKVIETMRQTGVDMQAKYKETSMGGLSVNVTDC